MIGDLDVELFLESIFRVATYAASVNYAERGRKRHAATEDNLVAATFAQKVHCFTHKLTARFAVSRFYCSGVEEVEFDHIEVPLVKNLVEERFDIRPYLFFFKVERIESAPGNAAYYGFSAL